MDLFTDLIRQHRELAPVQARYEEMARRYEDLWQQCKGMREINQSMRAEMECLRCQLQAMPPDVMGQRRGNAEALSNEQLGRAYEPILVAKGNT
jgi:hypothetical protein